MANEVEKPAQFLFNDIRELIDNSRQRFVVAVNAELTLLYWNIGKKINNHILGNERAEYGKQIVASLARQLTEEYGKGWGEQQIRHSLRSAETFSEEQILYAVRRELSWEKLYQTIQIARKKLENNKLED